jgi:hypothetical protein
MDEMEPYFVSEYDSFSSGYNMTRGGKGVRGLMKGDKHWNYGKYWSNEVKEKISNSLQRNHPQRYTAIFPDGHEEEFVGLRSFARQHNLFACALRKVLNGTYKQHKGFVIRKCS